MIYVRLKGGLGNQMFQYAFGQAIRKQTGTEVVYDTSLLEEILRQNSHTTNFTKRDMVLDMFPHINLHDIQYFPQFSGHCKFVNGKIETVIRKVKELTSSHFIKERRYQFDDYFREMRDGVYFDGNWQSYKYFESIKLEILNAFTFKTGAEYGVESKDAAVFEEKIISPSSQSVCIHIRRGDMALDPRTRAFHGTTSLEYYKQAIKIRALDAPLPGTQTQWIIFSDDIPWCKEHFTKHLFSEIEKKEMPQLADIEFTFFNPDWAGHHVGNQMRLMTLCDHFIIGNSTFGWWAAYLGEHTKGNPSTLTKKVIAPKHFFKAPKHDTSDLIPPHWLMLDVPLD